MRSKKNYGLVIIVLAFFLFIGIYLYERSGQTVMTANQSTEDISVSKDQVHYHAAVHHYKDGVLQDYSDFKFMSVMPCGFEELHDNVEKTDNVHLHDGNGEIVHVHIEGVVWQDFFDSIGIVVGDSEMYIDGVVSVNGLSEPIKEYQRVLVLENSSDDLETKLSNLPTVNDIKQAESISEFCGS